jgi:hypothetical protein
VATLQDPKSALSRVTWDTRAAILKLAKKSPWDLSVRSARRTCAEQADLYGIGRSYNLGSAPVTYQPGCGSWHVLGRAVDLDIVGRVDCASATQLGVIWEAMGGVWGGRFAGFGGCGDQGHFEWHGGHTLAELCAGSCSVSEAAVDASTVAPVSFPWVAIGAGIVVGFSLAWASPR